MQFKSQESRAGAARRKAESGRGRADTLCPQFSFPLPPSAFPTRPALTLIELLVVIVLLTTLVAAAIPIMSPSNDDRLIREASRGVNAFITGAQTKAIALRRPYGVALKKLSQDTDTDGDPTNHHDDNAVCVELEYVEEPPPYTGFDENSAARVALYTPANSSLYGGLRPLVLIQFVTRGNSNDQNDDGLPIGWDTDLIPGNVLRPGDVIEFNGNQYELMSDTDDNNIVARFSDDADSFFATNTGKAGNNLEKATQIVARPLNDTGQMFKVEHDDRGRSIRELASLGSPNTLPPFWSLPAPYKIYRQPMPASAEPYQLPEGTAIDLRASGIGSEDYFYVPEITPGVGHDNNTPAVIMFAPEGSVSRVRFGRSNPTQTTAVPFNEPVTETVFLLVGRREIIPAPLVDDDKSLNGSIPSDTQPDREQLLEAIRDPVNWLRGESRWIAIGSQSGRVVTTENGFVPLTGTSTYTASEISRNEQIIQSREFARQMTQMGGG